MEDRKELVEKLRVIANRIERNRLDYRYAYDRIILDKLYEELNQTFNNYLKIKNENENKVKSIKKKCLIEGLDDIALSLEKTSQIDNFEKNIKENSPWLLKND